MIATPHRMRDLVRLTGISAPTIHFYAQQGLLPRARKTAGNQARYPEATVRRLHWIRALRGELDLPVRTIAWILEEHGELPVEEIRALQSLGMLLQHSSPAATTEAARDVEQRLEDGDLDVLRRLGMVSEGALRAEDVRLLELVAAMRAAGFTTAAGFDIAALGVYRDAVQGLVVDELRQIIEPVLTLHDSGTLHDLVQRGLPLADQLLSVLHRRALQAEIGRWLAGEGLEAVSA